jgi:hypothetical protein
VKVLDIFLWCLIQILVLVARGFLVSLSLLKDGILDFVGKCTSLLIRQLRGESDGGVFIVLFSLVWWAICYKQELWSSLTRRLTCEQLQLWSVIAHYQFMHCSPFHPTPTVSDSLQFIVFLFRFCLGGYWGYNLPMCCTGSFSQWGGVCGVWHSPVWFADFYRQLWNGAAREKWQAAYCDLVQPSVV